MLCIMQRDNKMAQQLKTNISCYLGLMEGLGSQYPPDHFKNGSFLTIFNIPLQNLRNHFENWVPFKNVINRYCLSK